LRIHNDIINLDKHRFLPSYKEFTKTTDNNEIDNNDVEEKNSNFPSLSATRTSSINFLSNSILLTLSTNGNIKVYNVINQVENSMFPVITIDTSPPSLGPCSCSVYLNSTSTTTPSQVVLLRSVDSFTSQLFKMTLISVIQSLNNKILEGSFDAAIELATRMNVNLDIVYKAEWIQMISKKTHSSTGISNKLCKELVINSEKYNNVSDDFNGVHLTDVSNIFSRIRDDEWVIEETYAYVDNDTEIWLEVLKEGLERCKLIAQQCDFKQIEESNSKECTLLFIRSLKFRNIFIDRMNMLKMSNILIENLISSKIRLSSDQSEIIENDEIMLKSSIELNSENNDDNDDNEENLSNDITKQHPLAGLVETILAYEIQLNSSFNRINHTILGGFMNITISALAKYLAYKNMINELKYLIELFPFKLQPIMLDILSFFPISSNPSQYKFLLPAVCHKLPVNNESPCIYKYLIKVDDNVIPLVSDSILSNVDFSHTMIAYELLNSSKYNNMATDIISHNFNPIENNELNHSDSIIKWYIKRTLLFTHLGQDSFGYQFSILSLDRCVNVSLPQSYGSSRIILKELNLQLYHFCRLLYIGLIHSKSEFLEWVTKPIEKKINEIFIHYITLTKSKPIVTIINNYIKCLYEGTERLLQYVNIKSFLTGLITESNYSNSLYYDINCSIELAQKCVNNDHFNNYFNYSSKNNDQINIIESWDKVIVLGIHLSIYISIYH
jgi:hypothetical protein